MRILKWSKNLLLFLFIWPTILQGQNIDKILAEHFTAIGQDNLMSMRSIAMEVREMDGFANQRKYRIIKKAPNKIRVEGEWQDSIYVKAFDGERAWTIAPWTGVHAAQLMTEREKNLILMDVGIGSPLYDYGLNNTISLMGSERADDANHHVIRLTSPSGFFVDYLLDKNEHTIHLARVYKENEPEEIEKEVIFKNYKNLGGISIPFGFENRKGSAISDIVVDDIIFGQGAPNSIFEKPEN